MAKKDIFILNQVEGRYPDGEFEISFGSQPKSVVGIQKLINTFLLYFLTARGSELTDFSFGTFLGTNVGGNLVPILRSRIRLDLAKTSIALKNDQNGVPDDEALDSIKIINMLFLKDTVDLTLEFRSKAGETLKVTLPSIAG